METEKKLKKALAEMDRTTQREVVKGYEDAWEDFQKLVKQGVATPRGNQQEDILARHTYSF